LLLFRFLLPGLVIVDVIGIENVDLEVLKNGDDVLDVFRTVYIVRKRVVDVLEGQVALFLGQTNQEANLVVD
jgi:hypothetical protein